MDCAVVGASFAGLACATALARAGMRVTVLEKKTDPGEKLHTTGIIVKEAIDPTRTKFDYDTQQYAYEEVQRLLDSAIVLLKRTDGAVDRGFLAVGDHIYGDRKSVV